MDPLGGRRVLRMPRCRGVPHRLAGMGSPNVGDCDANHESSSCECSSRTCRAAACPSGMAAACAQPRHSVRDPCQRDLLSHTPHDRTEPSVAGRLHRCASLRALLVLGLGRLRPRRCAPDGDCHCLGHWYFDDGEYCLVSQMAQQSNLWRVASIDSDRGYGRAAAMRLTASGSSRSFSQAKLNRANGLEWPSKAYRRPVYQDTPCRTLRRAHASTSTDMRRRTQRPWPVDRHPVT
jgi:hypothetical protein